MKLMSFIVFIIATICGCKDRHSKIVEMTPVKELAKLEKLMQLSPDSAIKYCDLSHDSLSVFPDLSEYTINTLDLSFNQLDTLIIKNLPKELKTLNLSYNYYSHFFIIPWDSNLDLYEVNLSHNTLKGINIGVPVYRVIASYNHLEDLMLNHKHIHYLDVSYNKCLNNKVSFYPLMIDTIVHINIANDKPMYNGSIFGNMSKLRSSKKK